MSYDLAAPEMDVDFEKFVIRISDIETGFYGSFFVICAKVSKRKLPNAAVKNDFLHCRHSCYALVKVLLSMLKLPLVVMPV